MTPEDIRANKEHPARRLGAAGLVLAVARWQWWGRSVRPNTSSYSRGDWHKAYQSAIRLHELQDIEYRGYQYGLAEGRRLVTGNTPKNESIRGQLSRRYTQTLIERGNTVADIARLVGVTRPTVYGWIAGKGANAKSLSMLANMCGERLAFHEPLVGLMGATPDTEDDDAR